MLRSNRKSLGNHVVSTEGEKERLQWEGVAEKEDFKPGMKELVYALFMIRRSVLFSHSLSEGTLRTGTQNSKPYLKF